MAVDEAYECTFCRRTCETWRHWKVYVLNPAALMPRSGSGVEVLISRCCEAPTVSLGRSDERIKALFAAYSDGVGRLAR